MSKAISFVPDVIENQDGTTTYDFDGGTFIDGDRVVEMNNQNLQQQEANWHQGEDGSTFYYNEANETDLQSLLDNYGGPEAYAEMTKWASINWGQSAVDEFDQVIESGDLTAIGQALSILENDFHNRNTDDSIDADTIQQQMVGYLKNNFNDQDMQNFQLIMEQGSPEMQQELYRSIAKKMNLI